MTPEQVIVWGTVLFLLLIGGFTYAMRTSGDAEGTKAASPPSAHGVDHDSN
jgi:hypothetical protein